ncbi:Uncharacterised protein [Paenibacillus macerans]|uniref:Putative membrane protein n=1 Tax=Paenibacillus macerans TaxID=44252 RepID=A0A090ZNK2_PAEMA|nr:putative membrane protein [Paenibacillus macerans]SUA84462.1 Uncharacterised protein [Paenibacillus macerans]
MKPFRFLMKSFRFWLVLISFFIIIVNISGNDDYNILFAIFSPLVWLYESSLFVRKVDIPITVVYLTTLVFWYLVGFILDRLLQKLRK